MPLGALRRVEGERRVVERRGPVLKMVGAFEHSTKQHPLIPMGTPDPYAPPPPR